MNLKPLPELSYLGDDVSYGYDAEDMRTYAQAHIAELEAQRDDLRAALRRYIRMYRVDDGAWDPEAETDRIMEIELHGQHHSPDISEHEASQD